MEKVELSFCVDLSFFAVFFFRFDSECALASTCLILYTKSFSLFLDFRTVDSYIYTDRHVPYICKSCNTFCCELCTGYRGDTQLAMLAYSFRSLEIQ